MLFHVHHVTVHTSPLPTTHPRRAYSSTFPGLNHRHNGQFSTRLPAYLRPYGLVAHRFVNLDQSLSRDIHVSPCLCGLPV